jgi:hypothetical protein
MAYGKTLRGIKNHFKKHGHSYAAAGKEMYSMWKQERGRGKGHHKKEVKGNEQSSAGKHPQDIGGITTYNRHRLGPKHTPKFEKMSGPCNIQIDSSATTEVTAGFQNWVDYAAGWVQGSGTSGNWTGDLGYVFRASNTQRTTQFGGSAAATSVNFKTFLSYASQTVFLQNASVHPVVVTLYDYEVKEDATLNALQMMGNSVIADGQNNLGTSALPSVNNPGYKPLDSSAFRQAYKIKQSKQLILAGGECHQHKVKMTYNKLVDEAHINEFLLATSNTMFVKGVGFGTLIRYMFFPGVGATSGTDLADGCVTSYCMNKYYYRLTGSTATHNEIATTYVSPLVGNLRYVDQAAGQVLQEGAGGGFLSTTGTGHT